MRWPHGWRRPGSMRARCRTDARLTRQGAATGPGTANWDGTVVLSLPAR